MKIRLFLSLTILAFSLSSLAAQDEPELKKIALTENIVMFFESCVPNFCKIDFSKKLLF